MWTVIIIGALMCLYAIYKFEMASVGIPFLVFAILTVCFGSRIIVEIPRVKGQISLSDTFLFLAILLFGGEAGILLAGADALCSTPRFAKKWITIVFNTAVFIVSTSLTVIVLRSLFGSMVELSNQGFTSNFIIAICLMAVVQYAANSGLVATCVALKEDKPIWKMWKDNFLWTSLTYFAGASAAGITAQLIGTFGIFAFFATVPVIVVVYFTYTTYLKNVEAAARQAELAQKHVEELSHYITEQERISRALKESEEYFRNAFDHAAGMALIAPQGRWLQVNESLCQMLGYTEAELLLSDLQTITHEDDLGNDLVHLYDLIEGKIQNYQLEKRFVHKFGHSIWVLQSASVIRDEDKKPRQVIFQVQDISDRKRAEEQIHYAAFHDALTGLPNRTLLLDRLGMAVERAKRLKDYKFAVLFVDLDRFKIVNDSLGHDMGDKLLVDLSRRLESCARKIDTVARLGGDEFAILIDAIPIPNLATEVAERIQGSLSQPFELDGQEFFTTASIGIAYSETGYERPEDILRDADTAMYRAKANGKARHEVFDVGMHTHALEALRMENDLRRAVENNEIIPFYQSIISFKTGKIVGFEALARWRHPSRGFVSPADFIPLAEETGLIIPLGQQMLEDACRQTREWQKKFKQPLTISVNLSANQFKQKNIVEKAADILIRTGLVPRDLRLEITEGVLMHNAAAAEQILSELKAIGVQLSIDDFGTGYSSLSYLHRFPFDILKIDRSFVSRMNTDKESWGIVKTIITLAQELEKSVVAEGVETENHRELLKRLSCQYGQGFLFSRPLEPSQAEKLLEAEFAQDTDFPSIEILESTINLAEEVYAM
ncbi:MAG: EAL domain-containing protein [Acidobacteriota bacterium]|nr:EAL domain-containing protein [Acidobacteriota bacterium]